MKNVLKKLTFLMIPFLVIGCNTTSSKKDSSDKPTSASVNSSQESKSGQESKSSESSASSTHVHKWSVWKYDGEKHWHECVDCGEKKDEANHEMGEWQNTDPANLKGEDQYKFAKDVKTKKCKTCEYTMVDGTNILPELRFNFDPADPNKDFATIAKKDDITRPEVTGTYTLSNCPSEYAFENVAGTMKVRGNQTAGWRKKAFRIKFGEKRNVLGLNGGKTFKKWVLLADAKDTTLIRSATGLFIAREVCKEDNQVWVCDYTPVTVYLNNQYWGFYYLAEQKEVKEGRINLPEVKSSNKSTEIGYCFELDYYATGEIAKGADGDATFEVKYSPRSVSGNISGPLPPGNITTYTMLSDITDGPKDAHTEAGYKNNSKTSNSAQLTFIRDRMEKLYTVLYEAAVNKTAKEINDNGEVVASSKSVQAVIEQYFDVNAWADGFIINAFSCPPDLGYSSFYMSYDNTPNGNHKLRYDCPWDFDSNFGNRKDFIVDASKTLYVDVTHNMWIQLFSKLSFFIDVVKTKWNALREAQSFERMFHMMRESFANYDAEIKRNHYKWPENDAASMEYNNFDEIRDPFRKPAQYKEAETETISWCAKRVNFLEKQWGNNRPDVNTNA